MKKTILLLAILIFALSFAQETEFKMTKNYSYFFCKNKELINIQKNGDQ